MRGPYFAAIFYIYGPNVPLQIDLSIDMSPVTVVNIHRLGKQTTDASRPCPVKVTFFSNLTKQSLYKDISALKDNEKWNCISINDDVTDETKKHPEGFTMSSTVC